VSEPRLPSSSNRRCLSHGRRLRVPMRSRSAFSATPDPSRIPSAPPRPRDGCPHRSRVRLLHVGAALDPGTARRARDEARRNPRYRWLGALPRGRALRVLARSRLLVLTSRLEGGSNALSEALACDVPVVSSRIPGIVGTLGRGYPGYFPVGDTRALARLMHRAETDHTFYAGLKRWCRERANLVAPAAERRAWAGLLRELRTTRRS
jgi:glycosyltransferase involved in cell wall biosynthesis